jgi:hypothetical protein
MAHDTGREPRRGSVHDLENAETTMRGVSPSFVSIVTYAFVRSRGMPRSKTGSGRAWVRPGMGRRRQNERLGVENEQKTAPPPPAAALFAVPLGEAPDCEVIHTKPNLQQ